MEIINMKLSELKPYERNPRKNDDAVIPVMNSIKEFGFKVPIVIDKDNIIVCGHTRYKAAKKLKLKQVPCIIADDLSNEQIQAFRLADNKVGELAEWDNLLLDAELDEIFNIDMQDFGFIDDIINDEAEPSFEELENENTKNNNVIVTINIKNVAEWNMIENEVKNIVSEINATLAVKMS